MIKIEHVALYTKNLEKTRDFFVKYFGAVSNDGYHNKNTGFRSYFLRFSDGARLEIMNRPETNAVSTEDYCEGYHHIAFSIGSKEKVDNLTKELSDDGYRIISGPRLTGDGYYESCAEIGNIIVEITV